MLVLRTVSGSFPRFRAYHSGPRKNRHSDRPVFTVPGDIRRVQHSLSRPIVGHTPRKLPAFAAISRIIADCVRSDAPLSYNTQPCVSRVFLKIFSGIPGLSRPFFGQYSHSALTPRRRARPGANAPPFIWHFPRRVCFDHIAAALPHRKKLSFFRFA